jgi:hypothetical protein
LRLRSAVGAQVGSHVPARCVPWHSQRCQDLGVLAEVERRRCALSPVACNVNVVIPLAPFRRRYGMPEVPARK